MLFVPPSIPFMVPEAEAADVPDAIVLNTNPQVSVFNGRSDRNNITLSWSAPNDNGSSIIKYWLQKESFSNPGTWINENTNISANSCCQYTDINNAVGYQFSYRIMVKNAEGWSQPSNVVQVWSFPHAVYGVPQAGQTTDTTPPTVNVPSDISITSTNPSGASVTFDVTVADAVGIIGLHPSQPITETFPDGYSPICSTTSGHNGNPDKYFSDFTHQLGNPIFIGQTVNLSNNSGHFDIKTTTVTCTATDMSGNVGTGTFTVTVTYTAPNDTTPPTITFPSAIANGVVLPYPAPNFVDTNIFTWLVVATIVSDNVAIDTSLGLPITQYASAAGLNCDKEHLWNINHSSWQEFPSGDTTITCTATDTSGNIGTASFTVTAVYEATAADTTPPVLTINPNSSGVFALFVDDFTGLSDSDCWGGPQDPLPGNIFPMETLCPTLGMKPNWSSDFIIATDDVGVTSPHQLIPGQAGPTCSPWVFGDDGSSLGSTWFPTGDSTITCTATDAAGNVGSLSFTIRISAQAVTYTAPNDTTSPTVNVPSDISTTSTNPSGASVTFDVSATDDVSVTSGPTCSPASGTNFSVGTTTVTCTASDAAGNTGTDIFTVTVTYTEPEASTYTEPEASTYTEPEASTYTISVDPSVGIGFSQSALTIAQGDSVTFTTTAPPPLWVSITDPAGGFHQFDTNSPVTWTFNQCGIIVFWDESSPAQFAPMTLTIGDCPADTADTAPNDTTSPTVNVPSDISITSTNPSGASVTFDVSATDDVSVTSGPTCSPASGTNFSVGTTTVTCTASDAAGNTGTDIFTVTVTYTDETSPVVLVPDDITIQTADQNGSSATFNSHAIDNVDGVITTTCNYSSGYVFPISTTEVVCTATDSSGNTSSNSFNVTIEYTETLIPQWVKNVAGWWADGIVSDKSFLEAISYLIKNNVIIVPTTESGTGDGTVPDWVKNNAGWWADGMISDDTFMDGMTYLIQLGLIQVD